MGNMTGTHNETLNWIQQLRGGWTPVVCEPRRNRSGQYRVTPDTVSGGSNNHDDVRHHALWGNLMAGGAGVEWYFGYSYPHSDLTAQDWRSRDQMWDYTRYALEFSKPTCPSTKWRRMTP